MWPWAPVKTEHMIELEAGKNLMSTIVNIGLLPTAQMEVGPLGRPYGLNQLWECC